MARERGRESERKRERMKKQMCGVHRSARGNICVKRFELTKEKALYKYALLLLLLLLLFTMFLDAKLKDFIAHENS